MPVGAIGIHPVDAVWAKSETDLARACELTANLKLNSLNTCQNIQFAVFGTIVIGFWLLPHVHFALLNNFICESGKVPSKFLERKFSICQYVHFPCRLRIVFILQSVQRYFVMSKYFILGNLKGDTISEIKNGKLTPYDLILWLF